MKRWLLVTGLVLVLIGGGAYAANDVGLLLPAFQNDLDAYMEHRLQVMGAPGMAAGIVDADGLAWAGTYGTYNGTDPVSQDTVFMTASVSKLMVATAAMQLYEQGLFGLDDDVNDYLSFPVRNPDHPDAPITFRQLMTHRSSIADSPMYESLYTIDSGGGDSPWLLADYVQACLVPGGELYDGSIYTVSPPGKRFRYSNLAVALLAHLVSVISGQTFTGYCQDHIFAPLGMEHTYYLLADIPASETELASCYWRGQPLPHYSFPDYPAGALRTTLNDLSRFAAWHLDPGGSDVALLHPETVAIMWDVYGKSTDRGESEMGLVWVHMGWLNMRALGHTGGDPGVSTALLLYPDEGHGTILFLNAMPPKYSIQRLLMARLRNEGRRMTTAH